MHDAIAREHLREIFRQIVLMLGGVFSLYRPDDELIWSIVRHLDQVFETHLKPAPGAPESPEDEASEPRVHPAVVELLANLDRHPRQKTRPAAGRER